MDGLINIFDTFTMIATVEEIVPEVYFFRDRYFTTAEEDIFTTNKVLAEYQKGDRRMAPFVSDRVGDIPMDRMGYQIHEYEPAGIAPSRPMTVDELEKRGFGEALYANSTPAERAIRMQLRDMTDLDRAISRREEWMCAKTMIDNACTMQTYVDAHTQGETLYVRYYDSVSDHTYTVAGDKKWGTAGADIRADIRNMCDMLADRGLPATDLVLGAAAYDALLSDETIRDMIKTFSGVAAGSIDERVIYPGVTRAGWLNVYGYDLEIFVVRTTYKDNENVTQRYFPTDGAMVTFPGCGHLAYGSVTQINFGENMPTTIAGKRVPKLSVNQENDTRKLRLKARPLAMPTNYCPWIYAAAVC